MHIRVLLEIDVSEIVRPKISKSIKNKTWCSDHRRNLKTLFFSKLYVKEGSTRINSNTAISTALEAALSNEAFLKSKQKDVHYKK